MLPLPADREASPGVGVAAYERHRPERIFGLRHKWPVSSITTKTTTTSPTTPLGA